MAWQEPNPKPFQQKDSGEQALWDDPVAIWDSLTFTWDSRNRNAFQEQDPKNWYTKNE